MKRYYATRKRIYDETKIDIYMKYSVQIRQLAHGLVKTLEFPGEFKPPTHLEPYLFSRVTADPAIRRLVAITNDILDYGTDGIPPLPKQKVAVAANRSARHSLFELGSSDDFAEDEQGEF